MSAKLLLDLGMIVLTLGTVAVILYGLDTTLRRFRFPRRARTAYGYLTGISLLVYLTSLTVLVQTDYFANLDAVPIRLFAAFTAGCGVGIFLLLRVRFRRLLRAVPEPWLVGIQANRLVTEGILFGGYLAGFVPFQLTVLGFNQDIVVGITALMGYFAFFGRRRLYFPLLIWNVFGILLQCTLFANLLMSFPSKWQVFGGFPSSSFIVTVPYVWLPGFLMPVAVCFHLFSLLRTWRSMRELR